MTFLAFVFLLIFVLNINGRLKKMEERLSKNQLPLAANATNTPQETPATETATQTGQIQKPITPKLTPPQPSAEKLFANGFIAWVKEDWLLKLGAFLFLIGLGWFTTYAFLNNWIGPMGRIALGLILGSILLLVGSWRIKDFVHQGGIFLVLGSTTILLTTFAAREVYEFFTQLSALSIMFMSTVYVAVVSVKYKNRVLALASLVLAGAVPLLLHLQNYNPVSLFMYLFVIVIGAIWVTALSGDRELTTAALILVWLYSLPYISRTIFAEKTILLQFIYAIITILFITNILGIIKRKSKDMTPDLITAVGNGVLLLTWVEYAVPLEWRSIVTAAWMLVFGVGAYILHRVTQKKRPFLAYYGVAALMLAYASYTELEMPILTFAFTLEAIFITIVAYKILKDVKIARALTGTLILPALMALESLSSRIWKTQVLHADFLVIFTIATTLLSLGLLYYKEAKKSGDMELEKLYPLLFYAGSFFAYALPWLSLQAMFQNDDTAVMISLVLYTLVGIVFYFSADKRKKQETYGAVVLGLVVIRLLLVDIWNMEITGRIITFFLIGTLFLSTAFLKKKVQNSKENYQNESR
jgi:uncharacterized membrane protein